MNNEPVAIRYGFDGYGYQYMDSGSGSDWQSRVKGEPLYTHPVKELTDENYKEALACLQFALDDTLDYIKLNNLGGENNHWIVWAKAILRKAQEK